MGAAANRLAVNFLFEQRIRLGKETCRIMAYDANHTDRHTGHMRIDVEVFFAGERVFTLGELYCAVNRWTAIDSDAAKALVLSLVAMKPGDTDADYFASYSPEQLAFAEAHGEEIDMARMWRFGDD